MRSTGASNKTKCEGTHYPARDPGSIRGSFRLFPLARLLKMLCSTGSESIPGETTDNDEYGVRPEDLGYRVLELVRYVKMDLGPPNWTRSEWNRCLVQVVAYDRLVAYERG
jgi:hypothetical protein